MADLDVIWRIYGGVVEPGGREPHEEAGARAQANSLNRDKGYKDR